MDPTGIPTVLRSSYERYCEEPFGQWGHALRIHRGELYVRLACPPGEGATPDPFEREGWSKVDMCLDCARELPRPQWERVQQEVARRRVAKAFDLPLSIIGPLPRRSDFTLRA